MRIRHCVVASSMIATGLTSVLVAPAAHATPDPWTPGTVFVAASGARGGYAGVYAITPDGSPGVIYNGTADDVATDPAGDVFIADCNAGVFELPADGSGLHAIATGYPCPDAVAVEPSGDVLFSASGDSTIYRIPDGSGTPVAVNTGDDVLSMAEDADGDLWWANGQLQLRLLVPGATTPVTVNSTNYAGLTRSVRIGPDQSLLVATGFGENAAEYRPDFASIAPIGYGEGYVSGAAATTDNTVYFGDATDSRIERADQNGVVTFAVGIDSPGGLAVWPPVEPVARTASAVTLTSPTPRTQKSWQRVELDATVTGDDTSGLVQFAADGIAIGAAVPVHSGVATLHAQLPPGGADHVTATFVGNATSAPSASGSITFTINPTLTHTSMSASASGTVAQDQPLDLTATVTSAHGTPSGQVQFEVAGKAFGDPVDVDSSGAATLPQATLPPGVQHVKAVFQPYSGWTASTSTTMTFTVTPPLVPRLSTRVQLSSPYTFATVRIIVKVKGYQGEPAPTDGTITTDNGALTCTGLVATASGVAATASCTGGFSSGSYDVTVQFSGSTEYADGSTVASFYIGDL